MAGLDALSWSAGCALNAAEDWGDAFYWSNRTRLDDDDNETDYWTVDFRLTIGSTGALSDCFWQAGWVRPTEATRTRLYFTHSACFHLHHATTLKTPDKRMRTGATLWGAETREGGGEAKAERDRDWIGCFLLKQRELDEVLPCRITRRLDWVVPSETTRDWTVLRALYWSDERPAWMLSNWSDKGLDWILKGWNHWRDSVDFS